MLSIVNVVELIYIGETRRTFKIRMSEHKKAIKNWDQNNAISHSTGQAILWGKCEIHGVEQNWRRIKEARLIRLSNPVIFCTVVVYTSLTFVLSPVIYPSINKLFGLCLRVEMFRFY